MKKNEKNIEEVKEEKMLEQATENKEEQCHCGSECKCKKSNGTLVIVFILLMFVCLVGGLVGGYMLRLDDKDEKCATKEEAKQENSDKGDNSSVNKDEEIDVPNDVVPFAVNKVIKMDDLKGMNKFWSSNMFNISESVNYTFDYGLVNGIDVKLNLISDEYYNEKDEYEGSYQKISLNLDGTEYVMYSTMSFYAQPIYEFAYFEVYPYKNGVLFVENDLHTWGRTDLKDPFIKIYAYNKNGKLFEIDKVINVYHDNLYFNDLSEVSKCPVVISGDKISYCKETNPHDDSEGITIYDVSVYEFDGETEKVVNVIKNQYTSEQQ